MNGGAWASFTKIAIPLPFKFMNFFTSKLQLTLTLQFPFQFVSCNSGNQLTEWVQLLISEENKLFLVRAKIKGKLAPFRTYFSRRLTLKMTLSSESTRSCSNFVIKLT